MLFLNALINSLLCKFNNVYMSSNCNQNSTISKSNFKLRIVDRQMKYLYMGVAFS